MKKAYSKYLTILAFAFILTLIPVTVYGEVTNDNPKAACTITDSNGNIRTLEYDFFTAGFSNFPNHGDRINIFHDGNVNKAPDEVFSYQSGDKVFKNSSDETVEWEVTDAQYGKSTLQMRVYKGVFPPYYSYGYIYNIKFTPKAVLKRAPLKSAVYSPSTVTVYSEDIKEKAYDGSWFYNFRNRAKHSTGSKTWVSAYEEGDSIVVTLQDNSTITFVNKVIWTDKGYNDRFVSSSGEIVVAKTNNVKLATGSNKVEVYLMNIPGDNKMYVTAVMKTGTRSQYENQQTTPKSTSEKAGNATNKNTQSNTTNQKNAFKPVSVTAVKNVSISRTGKKLKVKWKALTKQQKTTVNKFQIQYSRNKQFKKAKTAWVSKNKNSYVSEKLKKGKYYVRTRSMRKVDNKKYYSKWSAVKSIKIR